jgi:hypothetical protein
LRDVRRAVATVGEHRLEAERESLAREREQASGEMLAKITAEQREWFEKLLGVAQFSGAWSEAPQSLHRLPAQRHSPQGVFGQTINRLLAVQEISRKIRRRPEVANRRLAQDVIDGRLFILQSRTARAYQV